MPAAKKKSSSSKPGLYANIHAKQERVSHGSGEHMRKAGEKGAPSAKAFKESEKTASHGAKKKAPAKKRSTK